MNPKPRKKNPVLSIILVILILVILVEVFILVRGSLFGEEEEFVYSTPIPYVPPTAEPTPAPPIATPIPATATPVPTPDPTQPPTPAPTEEPEEDIPADDLIAAGSFSSSTGTALNLKVEWSSHNDGSGNAVIYLTGYLESHSLQVGYRPSGVHVSLAGYGWDFNGSSVDVSTGPTETTLFSGVISVPLGSSSSMSVTYDFKGSYSGTELPTITAEGSVNTGS